MYKICTLFISAVLSFTVNVYASSEIELSLKHKEVQTVLHGEESSAETVFFARSIMEQTAKEFGAESVLLETLINSQSLNGQYGPGQVKIMKIDDGFSLRYDLTKSLSKFLTEKLRQNGLFFTYGSVFRNEINDYSHLSEFVQFEFDQFVQYSLSALRTIYSNPSMYILDDAKTLEFAITVLERLGILNYKIRLNHRELVWYMGDLLGVNHIEFQNILDTLDKATKKRKNILESLSDPMIRGAMSNFSKELSFLLLSCVSMQDRPLNLLATLLKQYTGNQKMTVPLLELQTLIKMLPKEKRDHVVIDFTLARGANYYDGSIFEIFLGTEKGLNIGALFGGGRFRIKDPITGDESFGVGGAFGIERVYLALKEMQLTKAPQQRIALVGDNALLLLQFARMLREAGFCVDTIATDDTNNQGTYFSNFEQIFQIIQNDSNLIDKPYRTNQESRTTTITQIAGNNPDLLKEIMHKLLSGQIIDSVTVQCSSKLFSITM